MAKLPLLWGVGKGLNPNNSIATSICSIHCAIPLVPLSVEASGRPLGWPVVAMSLEVQLSLHAMTQDSERKCHLPPSFSVLPQSLLCLGALILTSGPCWVPGAHFPPLSFPHVAIFLHLDSKYQRSCLCLFI